MRPRPKYCGCTGSRYNVDRLTIRELNVLDSVVKMVDSARDLGVVVDQAHNGRPYCVSLSSGLLPVAENSTRGACTVDGCSSDGDPGIRLQSAGLLQLGTQRYHREQFSTPAVGAELISQDSAARTETGRRQHITPVLRQLHWLSVRRRVEFKLAVLMYKALHGIAQPYLSDDCLLVAEVGRRLRSAEARSHGHVLYRGPGPSLVTGVLLWLV